MKKTHSRKQLLPSKKHKLILIVMTLVLTLLILCAPIITTPRNIFIWAWERPEDFNFFDQLGFTPGVVYYAGDIVIGTGSDPTLAVRRNSLRLPRNTELIALVRIDQPYQYHGLQAKDIDLVKDFIIDLCRWDYVSGCQIDYEPKESDISTYIDLINAVRKDLPANKALSITALVSWCRSESWLDDLATIDYAVPMFYRLGADDSAIRDGNVDPNFMQAQKCQRAIGVSTDEPLPLPKYLQDKDVYLFNHESWNQQILENELARLNASQ